MAFDTYSDLLAEVATRLGRPDLAPEIPGYVALAEARLRRVLRTRNMVARASAVLDGPFSAVPGDFAGVVSFRLSGPEATELESAAPAEFALRADGSTGRPRLYAVIGGEFAFHPAPDGDCAAELTYRRKLPPLSDGEPRNWLLTEHPDAYLYGALIQAETRLIEDARVVLWKRLWDEALAELADNDRDAVGHRPLLRTELTWADGEGARL